MSNFDDNIKECPHCFGRVMIMSDGKCPTCWGDANVPNATGRRRYTVRAGSKLPAACVVCGEATKRRRTVTDQVAEESAYENQDSGVVQLISFALFGWMSGLLHILIQILSRSKGDSSHVVQELSVSVPQCRFCRKEEVRSLNANHNKGTLVIAAHERFIKLDANIQ